MRVLDGDDAWAKLGLKRADGVGLVAFESINRMANAGKAPWREETGLLSVWILRMFNASPATTVAVPINPGPESSLAPAVRADYFGAVPPERLAVRKGVVFFRGDGRYRSKIGVGPNRARAVLGSYDAAGGVLTLVQYTLPPRPARYVNSQWNLREDPYAGDVINSYSDDGKMGPLYELESSSPAAALGPRELLDAPARTIHLRGSEQALDPIARSLLGVDLGTVKKALPAP